MSCVVKDWAVDQVEKVEGRGNSMEEAGALKDLYHGTSWWFSVVNPPSHAGDPWFLSLVREIRFHMLHCTAKNKKALEVHVRKSVDNLGETDKDFKDASVETSNGNDTRVPRR